MKKDKFITDFEDIPTPRQKMPHLSLEERNLNFKEVDLGFSEEIALKETSRCLSCRRCIGCGLCLAECDQQAIVYDQKAEYTTIQTDSIVVATGTENFDARRKPELGYSIYPNVITSIEMERILNSNGPFGGILMRPSDGEIPQRIAFIQCVGSRDEDLGLNYCSNICCATALKQSMNIMDRIEGLDITIFFSDIRPFAKNSEHYYLKAKDEYGVAFIQAKINQVIESPENNNLTLNYSQNGADASADFDLVVLSTGMIATAGIKRMSRQFGVKLNKYGFFPFSSKMPVATSGDNVWLAGSMTNPADLSASLTQASAAAVKVLQSLINRDLQLNGERKEAIQVKEIKNQQRIGIFFCRYGLSSQLRIDQDDVIKFINESNKDIFVGDTEYACNTTGKNKIISSIAQEKLGRIIITPCYFQKEHVGMFQKLIRSAGLTEDRLSIFSVESEHEELHTEDVKLRLLKLIESESGAPSISRPKEKMIPEACVIGGSMAAFQCALDIAEQGFIVQLLVSEAKPDQNEEKIFWHSENLKEMIQNLKQQVSSHPRIQIHEHIQINKLEGERGNFTLSFSEQSQQKSIHTGAIVLATGAEAYQPSEFLYNKSDNVITQFELSQSIAEKKCSAQKIVMIQCIGSRQPDRPHCSQICCEQAIKNALTIKQLSPETDIHILHRDIRVYDFEEDNYAEAIEKGVKFIRMDKAPAVKSMGGKLQLDATDQQSGTTIELAPDLIVLSNGIAPPPLNREISKIMNVPIQADGFFKETDRAFLPLHSDQPGIFIAGLASAPQRLENTLLEATAVAGKVGLMLRNSNY